MMALSFLAVNFTAVTAEPKGEPEAIRECGNIHDLDMHQFPNNSIAVFINDECALNCTVDGRVMNTASINEGYICPRNVRGVSTIDKVLKPLHNSNSLWSLCF